MSDFMLEVQGPAGRFGVFHQDRGAGYLFVWKPETKEVLAQIRIYARIGDFTIDEKDIKIIWSSDCSKCGVMIWGRMHGIINVASGQEMSAPLDNRNSPAISDPDWLQGFDDYLDQAHFIRARQRYWKEMVKNYDPTAQPRLEDETPIETNFIVQAKGADGWFAVFEDDGDAGYLYLYKQGDPKVHRHLHVYDRSKEVDVSREDVRVVWNESDTKSGVVIWGKMRGIIDLTKDRPGRVWLVGRDTPGIDDEEWLHGF